MSAAPSAHVPAKRIRTHNALLDAAVTLLAEQGLEGSGIDELVRRAGVARGTFYNYFQSWDDLLLALAERLEDEVRRHVDDRLQPEWDATTTLACAMSRFIRMCVDDPRLGWAWIRLGPHLQGWLKRASLPHKPFEQAISRLCPCAVDYGAAHCLLAGTALMAARGLLEDRMTLEQVDAVIAMSLRGLGAPAERIPIALAQAREFTSSTAN